MIRRKKMIQKREAKQRRVDAGESLSRTGYWGAGKHDGANHPGQGSKLRFKPGTACIAGAWLPGKDEAEKPAAPKDQP